MAYDILMIRSHHVSDVASLNGHVTIAKKRYMSSVKHKHYDYMGTGFFDGYIDLKIAGDNICNSKYWFSSWDKN